jgi:phage terminase small subunit
MKKTALTLQQKRFVEAMADPQTKNQTEAAIKAGYSPARARVTASELVTKRNILNAIQERKNRVIAHARVTPEEVLGSAVFQMRSSLADVLNENGVFDLERARETGAIDNVKKYQTVTRIDAETGDWIITTAVEMYSSAEARREVARYIGLDKKPFFQKPPETEEEFVREMFLRLVSKGYPPDKVISKLQEDFTNQDVTSLVSDLPT